MFKVRRGHSYAERSLLVAAVHGWHRMDILRKENELSSRGGLKVPRIIQSHLGSGAEGGEPVRPIERLTYAHAFTHVSALEHHVRERARISPARWRASPANWLLRR